MDVMGNPSGQQEVTHDWVAVVDFDHLARIRRDSATFAQGGVLHLVFEVLAYADEEAEVHDGGLCVVTFHRDDSVSIRDNGRGTATRLDENGRPVKKPVMSSKDLRFFDSIDPPLLPDGHPRRGISVVAALSKWLVHTNRRSTGAWAQRYEHGIPVTDLMSVPDDGTTGTDVRFLPDEPVQVENVRAALESASGAKAWPNLSFEVRDERELQQYQ
jgi:topoisomerase-4 subunit B